MSAPRSERVVTLDILRGLAILGMVFLHNGAFHFAGLEGALEEPPPWLILTVFMLEGMLAMALRLGVDALLPGWNRALPAVMLFGLANVVVWHFLLRIWERADYRGSLEWWLARIRRTEDRAQALRAA